jgi:hypothetical protein
MTQPVKRGPGRPRKQPTPPAESAEVTPDTVAAETVEAKADLPAEKSDDERIGLDVHPLTEEVSFGDGSRYRCKDGKIVKKVA